MLWEEFKDKCAKDLKDFLETPGELQKQLQNFIELIKQVIPKDQEPGFYKYYIRLYRHMHSFVETIGGNPEKLNETIQKFSEDFNFIDVDCSIEDIRRFAGILEVCFIRYPAMREIILQICFEPIMRFGPLQPMRILPGGVAGAKFHDTDDIFRCYGSSPDSLVMNVDSLFFRALNAYFASIGKQNLILTGTGYSGPFTWIRDPMIRTVHGLARATSDEATEGRNAKILTGVYAKYRHYIEAHERRDIALMTSPTRDLAPDEIRTFEKFNIRFHLEHTLKIAGGNLIKATNQHGELIYIVGIMALFRILWITYLDVTDDPTPDLTPRQRARLGELTEANITFYREFKKTKRMIRYFLTGDPLNKNVIFIEHVSYHFDLDVTYICPGIICVNSYAEFLECRSYIPQPSDINLRKEDSIIYPEYFGKLNWLYGSRINHTIHQLRRMNFHVIPVAGASVNFSAIDFTDINRGEIPIDKLSAIIRQWILKNTFCFMNSIVIQNSADPNDCDLLIGSSPPEELSYLVKFFYDRFCEQIIRTGRIRRIIPISCPKTGMFTTESWLDESRGGLRCSVNKIPEQFISRS